jgi:hypothetical protein
VFSRSDHFGEVNEMVTCLDKEHVMTIPRTPLQSDLHGLLCLRHTPDMRLRAIVRMAIREDIAALRRMKEVRHG